MTKRLARDVRDVRDSVEPTTLNTPKFAIADRAVRLPEGHPEVLRPVKPRPAAQDTEVVRSGPLGILGGELLYNLPRKPIPSREGDERYGIEDCHLPYYNGN